MLCRSSYSRSLLVVKRSTAMPRSSFLMPHPLSVICTAQRLLVSAPAAGQRELFREPARTTGARRPAGRGTLAWPRPDLQQLEPAGLGHDGYVGGARVDAVLQKLLERIGRPVDDLFACARARSPPSATPARRTRRTRRARRRGAHGGAAGRRHAAPARTGPLARTSPAAIRLTVAWSSRRIVGASGAAPPDILPLLAAKRELLLDACHELKSDDEHARPGETSGRAGDTRAQRLMSPRG